MSNYHDTGYKEMFSYPELVQQLIEGFAPPEIAGMMDFSTLKIQSGHYITPLFEAKVEDVVWPVDVHWQGCRQKVYLYLLLEFQSSIDNTIPIRLMHYVACFYDHLLKNGTTTPAQGLPPVFPIVLYNGLQRWTARQDIYDMVTPEPPAFLRPYQPRLRYYLIDEGAYSDAELAKRETTLRGVFGIEKASRSIDALQKAVDRIIAVIEKDPHKARLDSVITRWVKRHLQRMGTGVDLQGLNSLVEDSDMLAENLKHIAETERQIGVQQGRQENANETARNLIEMGVLSDELIAKATGLDLKEVQQLKRNNPPLNRH